MKRLNAVLILGLLISSFCFAQIQTGNASYNPSKTGLTISHPSLSFNTHVLVTNLENMRSVQALVNGRIPISGARIADISKDAADVLQMNTTGTTRIQIEEIRSRTADSLPVPAPAPVVTQQPPAPAPTPPPPAPRAALPAQPQPPAPQEQAPLPPPLVETIVSQPYPVYLSCSLDTCTTFLWIPVILLLLILLVLIAILILLARYLPRRYPLWLRVQTGKQNFPPWTNHHKRRLGHMKKIPKK
ncbi:MAG: hypothetical protein LBK44_06755 [Spirochaetales bacterium]|jgi:hypothetical protein|nr:hypothetical protein [Spirochaetales bacterium]